LEAASSAARQVDAAFLSTPGPAKPVALQAVAAAARSPVSALALTRPRLQEQGLAA